jgi:hypothetical protein
MIFAFDAYVRRRLGEHRGVDTLTQFDRRTSTELIVDLSCIFFDTIINFVLEPECYPLVDTDWENLEDVGGNLGRLMAEQLRAGIRAVLGSLPRGIWQWTGDNENLIEGASTICSSIFAPIVEGVIRHIVWSVEVISVYPRRYPDTQPREAFELHRWQSLEAVANGADDDDRLNYVAFIRHHRGVNDLSESQKDALRNLVGNDGVPASAPRLKGILEDLGAYIDVGYHRFRIQPFFPVVESDEVISITRADITSGKLYIGANSSVQGESPRPVLRAYFCCDTVVMKPGTTAEDQYTLDLSVDDKCTMRDVVVVSNRGGQTRRRIVKL